MPEADGSFNETNNQASSVINLKTGEVVFSLLMKAFTFEKALMQEHFNEKYVESDDYPKATFKGTIQDLEIILSSNETFDLFVTGQLTMHGKTKNVETPVKITYKGETIEAECDFVVSPADFDIKIPNAVKENIAKEIKVTVNATYDEFK